MHFASGSSDFAQVKARFTFEGGVRGPEALVRALLPRGFRLLRAPVETKDVSALRAAVAGAERVLFFCFEALRFPGQRAALDLVNRAAPGRAVAAGHGLIYLLMVLVPSLALLRQYGSGKPFTPYGVPVMPGRERRTFA